MQAHPKCDPAAWGGAWLCAQQSQHANFVAPMLCCLISCFPYQRQAMLCLMRVSKPTTNPAQCCHYTVFWQCTHLRSIPFSLRECTCERNVLSGRDEVGLVLGLWMARLQWLVLLTMLPLG